jgi:hypothetical protein
MTSHEPQIDPESLVARIIAELQANPDAQRLLLRAMLTNEFLGMPARLDRIEQDIAEIKATLADHGAAIAELKTDVAQLKGDSLEAKLRRRIRSLVGQRLRLSRPRIMQSAYQEPREQFVDAVETSLDRGLISEEQAVRIDATDTIVYAQRRGAQQSVWVAIEASNKVDGDDIQRSRDAADALETVFGEDSIAVVVGYSIDLRDQQRADAAGVVYLETPRIY